MQESSKLYVNQFKDYLFVKNILEASEDQFFLPTFKNQVGRNGNEQIILFSVAVFLAIP